MHLTTPAEITQPLWEGPLEQPVLTMRSADGIFATIGEPVQWAAGQLLGPAWQAPVGDRRFYLLRLAFSLRPTGRAQVQRADFGLSLGAQGGLRPMVFDGYPREQTVEKNDAVTLKLGPELKLGEVGGSVGSVETTIDFGRVIPVITTDGLQEPSFYWRYTAHAKYPLTGSRMMYAVAALPAGLPHALATLELSAEYADQLGPVRLSTPDTARQTLRWVVGV